MEQTEQHASVRREIEQLTAASHAREILRGVGVVLGLALLWGLEIVRNTWFHTLDRLNIKPRRARRASAYPPGRPRKHHAV
jgi:hypothetical protein